MADYRTAYNPGDSPAVVTRDGRAIAGREWGTVNLDDPTARRLVDAGALTLIELPDGYNRDDLDPRARAAIDATDAARSGDVELGEPRATTDEELAAMGADELVAHLGAHPEDAERVAALEAQRTRPRSTVQAAITTAQEGRQ